MSDESLALALRALSHKERSVAELTGWLRVRELEEGEVERVIDLLVSIGTLSDARFAARFAEDKRQLSGWGDDRIRAALVKRGICADEIAAGLVEADGESEVERATNLVLERSLDLSTDRDRSRALGVLARRGYDPDVAYEAIRRAARGLDLDEFGL